MAVPAKRTKPVDKERRFDTTQLRSGTHSEFVHRDYAAHCFRWGWAARLIKPHYRVLDVGCGQEVPLARVLSNTNFVHTGRYVGVDMNPLTRVPQKKWLEAHGRFNFIERHLELGQFDVVTNFEVIEHMGKEDGYALLRAMRACLKDDGQLFLSTPVFNGKAAANHVHEWLIPELQQAFEETGFKVLKRYGTFASYHPLRKVLAPAELDIYERLREFYSDDILACFLAPLYPDHSRNNVWVAVRG